MRKSIERPDSMRGRVVAALRATELWPEERALQERWVHLVRSVVEKNASVKAKYKTPPIPMPVLTNIALLKLKFAFDNKEIASFIRGTGDIKRVARRREQEVKLLSVAYGDAQAKFPALIEALSSGAAFESVDLRQFLGPAGRNGASPQAPRPLPLHAARQLEGERWSDAFQSGEPNAICRLAEQYIDVGALQEANSLIDGILEDAKDHPGAWFLKARVLLREAGRVQRAGALFRIISKEADPLSPAEQHYEDLAFGEAMNVEALHRAAFDACVKALGLLSDTKSYEASAVHWSKDYGALRALRQEALRFVVAQAGERCNPYRNDSEIGARVKARLQAMRMLARQQGANAGHQVHTHSKKMRRRIRSEAEPLFSELTDRVVLAAYYELTEFSGAFVQNLSRLRLVALNFLRLVLPHDAYCQEVEKFVSALKVEYPPEAAQVFGRFQGPDDLGAWRLNLHAHLDAILSRTEQRELVRGLYRAWRNSVDRQRDDALRAIYDDDIRLQFDAGDPLGAYRIARAAESDGIYRRDDGHGALLLRRTAQRVLRTTGSPAADIQAAQNHVADAEMRSVAEAHYDDLLNDSDGYAVPEYLWDLGNE